MKTTLSCVLMATALTMSGCADAPEPTTGDRPGGPGVPVALKPVHNPADETFNLSLETTFLRQGERKTVGVTVYRNVNFNEEVTLGFGELPKGLSIDNGSPVIKRNEERAHFALTAAEDASIGDFSIRVTGHPTKGVDASNDFNITVDKKK